MKEPLLFDYFPNPSYGEQWFYYEKRRRLNYWFAYNVFPIYGKYWFYYENYDNIYTSNQEIGLVRNNTYDISNKNENLILKYNLIRGIENEIKDNFLDLDRSQDMIIEYVSWLTSKKDLQGTLIEHLIDKVSRNLPLNVDSKNELIEDLKSLGSKEIVLELENLLSLYLSKTLDLELEKTINKSSNKEVLDTTQSLVLDESYKILQKEIESNKANRKITSLDIGKENLLDIKKRAIEQEDEVLLKVIRPNNIGIFDNTIKSTRKISLELPNIKTFEESILKNYINKKIFVDNSIYKSKKIEKNSKLRDNTFFIDKTLKKISLKYNKLDLIKDLKNSTKRKDCSLLKKSRKNISNYDTNVKSRKIPKKAQNRSNENIQINRHNLGDIIQDRDLETQKIPIKNHITIDKDILAQKNNSLLKDILTVNGKLVDKNENKINTKILMDTSLKVQKLKSNLDLTIDKDLEVEKTKDNSIKEIIIDKDTNIKKTNKIGNVIIDDKGVILNKAITEKELIIENETLLKIKLKDFKLEDSNIIVKKELKKINSKSNTIKSNKVEKKSKVYDNTIKINKLPINTIIEEVEDKLDWHKRLWFIGEHNPTDYKILPHNDSEYPPNIEKLIEKPNGIFIYDYLVSFKEKVSIYKKQKPIIVELYDFEYNNIRTIFFNKLENNEIKDKDINFRIIEKGDHYSFISEMQVYDYEFNISIFNEKVKYIIIRHPLNEVNHVTTYVTSDKFLADRHPIPFGNDMGLKEFGLDIGIMTEFINIMMLFWAKYFNAFTGYIGTMAIESMLKMVYHWLTLETSIETMEDLGVKEHYFRCYRWLRWEAEKLYNVAKLDLELHGNQWIEELIYELVEYMEMHHFNAFPKYENVERLDELKNRFDEANVNIKIVLRKSKGIRKRALDKHKMMKD